MQEQVSNKEFKINGDKAAFENIIPIIINHTDGEEKIILSERLLIPNTVQYEGKDRRGRLDD